MADMGIGEFAAAAAISAALSVGTSYAMGALNPNVKGKLDSLNISTSTYGISIPRGWGTARYSGNLIWCSPIQETSSTGKGATNKTKQYKYLASFAYAFCAGPAEEILKVWADGHLIYDATGTGTVEHNLAIPMNWHNGSEDQLPDPAIEADKGVGQVPAFRGLVYIVGSNVDLNIFGGRLPSISAEIAFKGTSEPTSTDFTAIPSEEQWFPGGSYSMQDIAIDWRRKLAFRTLTDLGHLFSNDDGGLSIVNLTNLTETTSVALNSVLGTTGSPSGGPIATGSGQDVYVQFGPYGVLGSNKVYIFDKDGLSLVGSAYGTNTVVYTNNIVSTNARGAFSMRVLSVPKTDGGFQDYLVLSSPYVGPLILDGATLAYVWGAAFYGSDTGTAITDYMAPYYSENTTSLVANVVVPGAPGVGSGEVWYVSAVYSTLYEDVSVFSVHLIQVNAASSFVSSLFQSTGITPRHVVNVIIEAVFSAGEYTAGMALIRAEYDGANDALILLVKSDTGVERIIAIKPDGTAPWNYKTTGGIVGPTSGQSRLTGTSFAWTGAADSDGDNVFVLDTRTGTLTRKTKVDHFISLRGWEAYDAETGWIILNGTLAFGGMEMQKIYIAGATGQPQALSVVVADLCRQSGMVNGDFDVTELVDDVPGFTCQQESARKSIEQLAAAYFFDAVEHDDVLTFRKRGRATSANISYTDLKRVQNGENTIRPVIQPELETPRRVTVRWPDPIKDYQQNATHVTRTQQPSTFATIASIGENVVDLRVTLARQDAKNIAMRGLLQAWREREKYTDIQVGPKYLALEPTDTVNLITRSGDVVRVRLTKIEIGANWAVKLSGTVEDERLWAVTAANVDGGDVSSPLPFAGDYIVRAVVGSEFPLLRDEDDTGGTALRSYTAAGTYSGDTSGWRGSTISIAPDDATWATLSSDPNAMRYGLAVNALPAPHSPWLRDDTNTLTVRMVEGADHLETATLLQVMNGANPAALINVRTGEAEIIQYTTVTPLGGGKFALTGLYRGRRGSDWACGSHGAGDIFLLLETDTIVPITRPLGDLGGSGYVRAASPFQPLDSVSSQSVTWAGAAEKPYSPVHIEGSRDGSNNLTLTWVRRSRIGGEWVDGFESVPLGEASEAYQVDILNVTGGVVRTITGLSSPTATYSAANQTTDGLTPGDPVHVHVYQMSATVARGYPGDATV